ncbi:uncharacterized protein LOC122274557 [Carya illinoinensis]|uniref:uncharacterized protein LOC122274557 n=1 Tax=Carya illinoinensis TaxID=32201 RepID=UPI001C7265B6|nr:uncharacterized protein LOC122274557 [Carya illinoinensis]
MVDSINSNANQNANPNSNIFYPSQPNSPYFISSNDNSGVLVTQMLDSSNYHSWTHSIKIALHIKNKLGFVDVSICEPSEADSPLMDHWLQCNDIVITWLQNIMFVDIKSSTLYAKAAHQLWKELEQRLAQQNAPKIYEVKQGVATIMQNQDTVSSDTSNQAFPSLNEVYSIIHQEEKRQQISIDTLVSDSMAMIATARDVGSKNITSQRKYYCIFCKVLGHSLERCFKAKLEKPVCCNCKMPGNVAEKCFKLHGYPPGHKLHGKGRPAFVNQVTTLMPSGQEQVDNNQAALT